jgi:hypothetical protein
MEIITLCGSMRFKQHFIEWERKLTFEGNLVLSALILPEEYKLDLKQKTLLQINHFNKIDISNKILVLDVDNYIGEDTQKEIEYAKEKGKTIKYLNKKIFNKGDKIKCIENQRLGNVGLELNKIYEVQEDSQNDVWVKIRLHCDSLNTFWDDNFHSFRFELAKE